MVRCCGVALGHLASGGAPSDDLPLAVIALRCGTIRQTSGRAAAEGCVERSYRVAFRPATLGSKLDAINAATDVALLDKLHSSIGATTTNGLARPVMTAWKSLQSRDKAAQEVDVLLAQMQSWSDADEVPLTRLVDTQRRGRS